MFIRALAYIFANGPDGLRQTTEDAVLNANYIRKGLEGVYDLPYATPSMHEVVFSDKVQSTKGVRTMDLAKRLIEEVGLGLAPGRAFGPEGEGWLRWCYAADSKKIESGIERLAHFLSK